MSYETKGNNISTKAATAESIIDDVINKNTASTSTEATLMAADELKVADTISKERRSMSFYVTFMENISKMKAGEGNNSRINDAMNFLHDKTTTEIFDVKTGKTITVKGSPLDSPSLNAILMGKKVNTNETINYSSDRILTAAKTTLISLRQPPILPLQIPTLSNPPLPQFHKTSATLVAFSKVVPSLPPRPCSPRSPQLFLAPSSKVQLTT